MEMLALNKAQAEKIRLLKVQLKTRRPKKPEGDTDYELPQTAALRRTRTPLTPRTKVWHWMQYNYQSSFATSLSAENDVAGMCLFITQYFESTRQQVGQHS